MPRAAVRADLVEHLVAGEAARPGEKVPNLRQLGPLVPEGDAGLLVDVLDVRRIGEERGDKEIDPPLMPQELRDKRR